jgi:hypothetical protein
MSDSQSPDQAPKTEPPAVPSPPLPKLKPEAGSTPGAPIPSPPLPPIAGKTPPAPRADSTKVEHTEFKLSSDDDEKQSATQAALTPEEAALIAPAGAPATAPPAASPPRKAAPTGSTPNAPHTPAAPGRAPGVPNKAATPRTPPLPGAPVPGHTPPAPPRARATGSTPGAPHTPAAPPPGFIDDNHEEIPQTGFSIAVVHEWLNKIEPVSQWMFRVGLFFGVTSLAFLVYVLVVGKIGTTPPPAAMLGYIKLAVTVLKFSSLLLAISLFLLAFDALAISAGMAALGVLLYFGAPWLFANHIGTTVAAMVVMNGLRAVGTALTTLGLFKLALDVMQWIMLLPERMKQRASIGVARKAEASQQRVARDANVFSPCWKLPFCRETIRKQCPAFLAKQTCWKFGRGCYCDEEMISRIIRGESLDVIKAPTRLSKSGKPPCSRCHIYLEHQGHKFRALSPLTLPITALLMWVIWPFWTRLFGQILGAPIWNTLSFDAKKLAPEAIASKEVASGGLPPEQVMYYATIIFGVLLGFFVMIYVAKFIEWFVYKAKL